MIVNMGKTTEERILKVLAPMYEVMPKVEKLGVVALFKEEVRFEMIKGEAVHLIDKYGNFEKVEDDNFRCGSISASCNQGILDCM